MVSELHDVFLCHSNTFHNIYQILTGSKYTTRQALSLYLQCLLPICVSICSQGWHQIYAASFCAAANMVCFHASKRYLVICWTVSNWCCRKRKSQEYSSWQIILEECAQYLWNTGGWENALQILILLEGNLIKAGHIVYCSLLPSPIDCVVQMHARCIDWHGALPWLPWPMLARYGKVDSINVCGPPEFSHLLQRCNRSSNLWCNEHPWRKVFPIAEILQNSEQEHWTPWVFGLVQELLEVHQLPQSACHDWQRGLFDPRTNAAWKQMLHHLWKICIFQWDWIRIVLPCIRCRMRDVWQDISLCWS